MNKHKRLYRSTTDRKLAGVCGGIAEYLEVDPTFVRLIAAFVILIGGAGFFGYLIAWVIIPEAPSQS
jgi:phage shock protein C